MRAFLFLALLAVAGQVQAAQLLLEVQTSGTGRIGPFPQQPPATMEIGYWLGGSSGVRYLWDVYPTDVGKTFEVPQESLATNELTDGKPGGGFHAFCCNIEPNSFGGQSIDQSGTYPWGNSTGSITITRHVPLIGSELYGYQITSITDTLDEFTFTTRTSPHGIDTTTGKSTIRIYGDPIPPVPGDFNQDGTVDTADYVFYRNRYDTIGPIPNGSGNTIVYDYDLVIWRANFGHTFDPVSSALGLGSQSVPEPTTWFLIIVSSIYLHLSRFGSRVVWLVL